MNGSRNIKLKCMKEYRELESFSVKSLSLKYNTYRYIVLGYSYSSNDCTLVDLSAEDNTYVTCKNFNKFDVSTFSTTDFLGCARRFNNGIGIVKVSYFFESYLKDLFKSIGTSLEFRDFLKGNSYQLLSHSLYKVYSCRVDSTPSLLVFCKFLKILYTQGYTFEVIKDGSTDNYLLYIHVNDIVTLFANNIVKEMAKAKLLGSSKMDTSRYYKEYTISQQTGIKSPHVSF